LGRLDRPIARRIVRKLESAAIDPGRYFLALVGSDERKLRIGDYRLLALLDPTTRTVLVERVDHRSRIYR
jgi:mRNA-degrading endonuclease RelE of RelBE toxin-antitoxin system